MPSIIYGGLRYTQTRHAIYCKKCKETIESKHVHDFKYCSCQAVGIDGGISAGNRILGYLSDMEDRSMYRAVIQKKKVWLPQTVIEERFLQIQNQNILPIADTSARIPTKDPEPESA
jgi:hypothetical protein